MSQRFSLDKTDWQKWAKETLIFFAPTFLIVLSTLYAGAQNHHFDWTATFWAGYTSLLLSLKELVGKWFSGETVTTK